MKCLILLILFFNTSIMYAQKNLKSICSKLEETTGLYKSMREFNGGIFIDGLGREDTFQRLKLESDSLSLQIFNKLPPLHPSRIIRRMKILYGIDISNYKKEDIVYLGNSIEFGYTLYDTNSSLVWVRTFYPHHIYDDMVPKSFPLENYALFYQYIMYNDLDALADYTALVKDSLGNDWDDVYDFILSIYQYSYFFNYPSAINHVDKDTPYGELLSNTSKYYSNQKLDAISLYLKQASLIYEFSVKDNKMRTPLLNSNFNINQNRISYYKSIAAWLSFYLKFNDRKINKEVIKFLYEKEESESYRLKNQAILDKLKQELVENNYFGYTILREFIENPMRETPSINKLGIAKERASVTKTHSLLLEPEPYDLTYEIDTINTSEYFIAYETGHDNYYFIEIEKPVESPIAGSDGYAIFDGRVETVRGYLPKEVVCEISDKELLDDNKYTNLSKSKLGVIIDSDGHTNIRSEQNVNSTILGVIKEKEIFNYWETNTNWYVVQTKDSIRGYVYKNMIKEKVKTGGWTLD